MHSTPQPPIAAGEHFADAERDLAAALPLVKRGASGTAKSRSRSSMLFWPSPLAASTPANGKLRHDRYVPHPVDGRMGVVERARTTGTFKPAVESDKGRVNAHTADASQAQRRLARAALCALTNNTDWS
jgi:hypothetical protein